MLRRLWKPWFVWRPRQLALRAVRAWSRPAAGFRPLPVAWGATVLADPTKSIGHSIWTTGVYDLAVSEVLARLIQPGDTVVDAGANVGYMTVLAAVAAGPTGKVLAFEPHPELFEVLRANAAAAAAPVVLHNTALRDRPGTAELVLPEGMGANDGLARIGPAGAPGTRSVTVAVDTLDAVLGDAPAAVLKLDVEGFELPVLRGAARAIREKRIRHVVFEDHEGPGSAVVGHLRAAGYRLFAVGWSVRGLRLSPIEAGRLAAEYEAPNYLATFDPDDAARLCGGTGWRSLRPRLGRR